MPMSEEILELVDRCAILPRGLAFAHLAPIEAAAAALAVHPDALERLRAALDHGEARREIIRAYAEAVARAGRERPAEQGAPTVPAPPGPDELIRDSQLHPLGPAFLREAALEVAAIAFAVHPDVVTAARERMLDAELDRGRWGPLLAEAGVAALRPRGA